MAKDIEQELDAILTPHRGRVAQVRDEAAGKSAAEEIFNEAAALCLVAVITPALQQMAQALNDRGVAARTHSEASAARIDIPVSKHVRLGHGHGGYPYLRARSDSQIRRIRFERNTADSRGGSALGDYPVAEVTADLVKALVMDLVRQLYGPF